MSKEISKEISKQLAKCPFCGGEAELYDYESSRDIYDSHTLGYVDTEYFTKYGVGCNECNSIMAEFKSEEQAIKAWNTRKPMERIVEQIEAELDSSEKFMCEYDDSIAQKAYYSGMKNILQIVKEEGGMNV